MLHCISISNLIEIVGQIQWLMGGRAELETISLLIEGVGSDQDADLLRAKIRSGR